MTKEFLFRYAITRRKKQARTVENRSRSRCAAAEEWGWSSFASLLTVEAESYFSYWQKHTLDRGTPLSKRHWWRGGVTASHSKASQELLLDMRWGLSTAADSRRALPASTESTGCMKDLPFFVGQPSVLSDSTYPLSVAIVGLELGQTI